MNLKLIVYTVLLTLTLMAAGCSGNGEPGSAQEASAAIQENVETINRQQDELNKEPPPVDMPETEELETRMERIFTYFCDEAAQHQVTARIIIPNAPERFYLSDTLAMHLNKLKNDLAAGYSLRFDILVEPYKSKHGDYYETVYNVFIEAGGIDVLAVEVMYETQYNKFHEMKCWTPQENNGNQEK